MIPLYKSPKVKNVLPFELKACPPVADSNYKHLHKHPNIFAGIGF